MPSAESRVPPKPSRPRQWLLLAGVLGLGFALALPSLFYPLGADQGMFAYAGDRWLAGELPYRDVWDIKPPGVYAAYGLAQLLFGRTPAACRMADLLAVLLTAGGLYLLLRRQGRPAAGLAAALLFPAAYFTGFDYWHSAQAESFAAPVTVLFVYSAVRGGEDGGRRWWLLAGTCLGTLVLLKTPFVLYAPLAAFCAGPLLRAPIRDRARAAALLAAGLALPLAGTLLYFHLYGALGAFVELFAAQLAYNSGGEREVPRLLAEESREFLTHPALLGLSAAALAALALSSCRRSPAFPACAAWLALALAVVILQKRFFWYHWLPVLPPLALLAGLAFEAAWSQPSRTPRALGAALLVGAVLLPALSHSERFTLAWAWWTRGIPAERYFQKFEHENGYSPWEAVQVAEYVKNRTRPGDPLLVYSFVPAINYLAERPCPTRHVSIAPIRVTLMIPKEMRDRWHAELVRESEARPPVYFVTQPHWVGNQRTVHLGALRYELEHSIGSFYVYRLQPGNRRL